VNKIDTGIHIGTKYDKETIENLSNYVDKIFTSSFQNRIEPEVVIKA